MSIKSSNGGNFRCLKLQINSVLARSYKLCAWKNYLKHRRRLSAAEASCMASTAAICAASLYFRSSYDNKHLIKHQVNNWKHSLTMG